MERHGLPSAIPRMPTCLPRRSLPVFRPPSRRALRTDRRLANMRHGAFAAPPEPLARPPQGLGQPLRRPEPRADRRRLVARAAHPARLHGRREPCRPGLRRGRERLEPLRRGGQPGAGILLSPFPPLRRSAHRRRLGLPVGRRTLFRARLEREPPRTPGASARRKTQTRWPWLR